MKFVVKTAIAAVALWVVTWLPLQVVVSGGDNGTWWGRPLVFVLVGAVLVVFKMVLRPILTVLTLPVLILTLGLFSLVITWFILWLTAWVTARDFFSAATLTVGGFWYTLLAALLITVMTAVLEAIVPGAKERRASSRR